jgi:hypothetical protein
MTNSNKLADALDCFWNAALDGVRRHDDATANAVMSGMVQGFAAVAARLREHDAQPAQEFLPAEDQPPLAGIAGCRPLERAPQPAPAPVQVDDGWLRMTRAARDIQARHLDNHQGDVYHAMQSLVAKYGAPRTGPMIQERSAHPPAPAADGAGELPHAVRFFAADENNSEYEVFDSVDLARAAAQRMLDSASDDAADYGWTDEPPAIYYGIVLGACVESYRGPAPEGSDFSEIVNYRLADIGETERAAIAALRQPSVIDDELIEEAVNCAWHVAGTTLHSREDIKAAVKAIYPMFAGKVIIAAPALPEVSDGPLTGKYADVLVPFVGMMETELHANSGKGDRPGWLSMSKAVGMLEIYYHAAKLQKAVKDDELPKIREYAADVANMAMMLLDICGGLEPYRASLRGEVTS